MSIAKASAVFDIFINYRREDSRADAGRLYDRLSEHFGAQHVFMDIDDIDPGQNFAQVLENTLGHCSVVIAVIGRNWLECRDDADQRRLDDPNDFIQLELRQALARGIMLVPVLVGGATMPASHDIPPAIQGLASQQAFEVSDSRFHADVDALIVDLESANKRLRRTTRRVPAARIALAGFALLCFSLLLYFSVGSRQQDRALDDQAVSHLEVGDRFAANNNYAKAIAEYNEALEYAPNDRVVLRKLVSVKKERLLASAFTEPGNLLDIALRPDIERYAPVPATDVDDALASIYRLQSLDPTLKDDVELMLVEALIWKSSGQRSRNAIPVLTRAAELAPDHARVLGELGLLRTVIAQEPDAVDYIRRAIELDAQAPRYRYYLARALAESYLCPYAGYDYKGAGDGTACAEAIQSYRRAHELATSDDVWSRHMRARAPDKALAIFHRYVIKEQDILSPKIDISVDDRIEALEYLIPLEEVVARNGYGDYPRYWLALMYESKGELDTAADILRELMEDTGREPELWLQLQTKISQRQGIERADSR